MDKVQALEDLRDRLRDKYVCFNEDRVTIGDFTYGMPVVRSWGNDASLTIGKFCCIGWNVRIYLGGNHHNEWCTTYPFNALLPQIWGDVDGGIAATKGDVKIGNDVWIADNVMIMSGVTIGNGATVAAGAVVTKDVLPYEVVGGVPARTLRTRWAAMDLQDLEWWDWPLERIAEAAPLLMSRDADLLRDMARGWDDLD